MRANPSAERTSSGTRRGVRLAGDVVDRHNDVVTDLAAVALVQDEPLAAHKTSRWSPVVVGSTAQPEHVVVGQVECIFLVHRLPISDTQRRVVCGLRLLAVEPPVPFEVRAAAQRPGTTRLGPPGSTWTMKWLPTKGSLPR